MIFIETPTFAADREEYLPEDAFAEFQQLLADRPDADQELRRRTMHAKEFEKLLKSVKEAGEIVRGERPPAREAVVDSTMVKELRKSLKLSQVQFAALLTVDLGTLRNWEQGRRKPHGPAKALLRAIRNDPRNVLRSLAA